MNKFILALLIFTSPSGFSFSLFSAGEITAHWSASSDGSGITVDHGRWDSILERYVNTREGINYFSYGKVTADDRGRLQNYLQDLRAVAVTELGSREQFAYWINLYNALTVETILRHYPVESILDVSFGLTSRGPWKEKLVSVEGIALSLDDIEHKILRPIFKDNRIHYAVNCASIGCPNLQRRAFTADNLEDLLTAAAEEYINHPRGVAVGNDGLIVSSIFDWYAEDFGDDESEIIRHFVEYAGPELLEMIAGEKEIDDYRYDWSLNE